MRFLAPLLVILLAACGGTTRPGPSSAPVPGGGTVAGRLFSQRSDGSDRMPVGGQAIGVFRVQILAGPVMQHPPAPIVTTRTEADGDFAFHGLRPGHYFITAVGASPVPGRWVTVTAQRGATVLLIRCTDCPVPL